MLSCSSTIPATRNCSFYDVPPEILPMIFKYLSVNERKAVKLVCKTWFDVCELPTFSDDEVIKCLGCYKLSDTYKFLRTVQRKSLNLRFNNVKFTGDSLFWKINGSRIRSITFENCIFPKNFLGKIIYFCDKLNHLSFRHTIGTEIHMSSNLTAESGKGIVRENLQSLEIHHHYWLSPEIYINHLLSIFPQLKVLKIYTAIIGDGKPSFFDTQVENYLTPSKDRLEKLSLDILHFRFASVLKDYGFLSRILPTMKRLTELTIHRTEELESGDLEDFLYSLPLRSLEYYRTSNCEYIPVESFLVKLLSSNSNLEHLKLHTRQELVVTKCLFEKLTSSNLKSCILRIDGAISVQDIDFFNSYFSTERSPAAPPSLTLSVSKNCPTGDGTVSFPQCFPNIEHLHITSCMSPSILQSLFKYQKKLKSLIVDDRIRRGQTTKYVRICKDEFNQLTDLQRLELEHVLSFVFLKSLSPELVLTNLKYLKIDLSAHICGLDLQATSETDLLKLADATPFLEALYVLYKFKNRNVRFNNLCTELCTKLSQLQYLRWHEYCGAPFCTDENYRKIFSISSSLRVLCHLQSTRTNKYFYDSLNQKVTRVEADSDLYTFTQPKIGGLTIDWLTF